MNLEFVFIKKCMDHMDRSSNSRHPGMDHLPGPARTTRTKGEEKMRNELIRLRALMFDLSREDEFEAAYIKIVEDLGSQMIRVANVDKLLEGYYTQQLAAARALLMEQIEWMNSQRVEGEA